MFIPSKFKGKKACVLGMGRSGVCVAQLLKRHGFKVLLSEETAKPVPSGLKGIDAETGGHTEKVFECAFVVKSPGIAPSHHVFKKLKKLKIPVFSEIETAAAFAPKDIKIFAVTGTNGKTTTAWLLNKIMLAHVKEEGKGRKVYTLGNMGKPFASAADKIEPGSIVVLEVSSYQLEDSSYFRPAAGALLNITPDHLEHHGSFKKYAEAKKKIFKCQTKKQVFVTNGADAECVKLIPAAPGGVYTFSSSARHSVRLDVVYDGDELIFASGYRLKPPRLLPGMHNIENAMAAALMAFAGGVSQKAVQKGFDTFKGLEHRIEFFAEHKGVKFYNDSKATNVDSTLIALKALQSKNRIWIILGGRGKGFPYAPLIPYLNKYCKRAVLIGEAAREIKKHLAGRFSAVEKGDIKNALEYIFKNALEGDIVLLSPACASFDQFKNFEDRGRKFKHAVREYIKKQK
jgi:UDP-N-acetylmuramoylalanine--D-glutamate ligase